MSKERDTVKLLQECDSGTKMSITSLNDAAQKADNEELRKLLKDCTAEHAAIGREIQEELRKNHAEGKNPAAIATAMSKLKIGAQMLVSDGDETTAKLMYDGCSMGIEKLSEYVNMYPAAESAAKNVADKLIRCEQRLADQLRAYL